MSTENGLVKFTFIKQQVVQAKQKSNISTVYIQWKR